MADQTGSEEKEKSLYLMQIRYLDQLLERCQLKCDELQKQNNDLVPQYIALEKDKKDITEHLKRSLFAKETELDKLSERLESQQQAAERDGEALKLQHSQQMDELQGQVDELNSGIMMQTAKCEEQQEQLLQQMQQLSDMESVKEQLISQKVEHEAAIHSLKEEAERKMNDMMLERLDTLQVCVKTRTSDIVEGERAQHRVQMEQLQVLLDQNMELWRQKDALWEEESVCRTEMEELKKDLDEVTQESFTHKKEVEQLMKKSQQLEVELKDCSLTQQHMQEEEEELRQLLASAAEECRQKTAEAAQLGAELQEEGSRRRQLEGVMQEAVIILRHILTDSEKASETQWKMQRLLEVLESSAPQGTGSTRGRKPQTCDPKPARAQTLNLDTDPAFLMIRYRPGDLGLVPPPRWKLHQQPAAPQQPEDVQL